MAECVYALITVPTIADFHRGAFGQPHAELGLAELDRSIRNIQVLHLQVNLGNRCDQISLQTEDFISLRCDPGMTLQPEVILRAVDTDLMKRLTRIRALFET